MIVQQPSPTQHGPSGQLLTVSLAGAMVAAVDSTMILKLISPQFALLDLKLIVTLLSLSTKPPTAGRLEGAQVA